MRPSKGRLNAETLFVCEGRTVAQIAAKLGLSEKTIAQWCAQGDWAQRRTERLRESPQAALDVLKHQRELLIQEFEKKNKKRAGPEEIDALQKLSLAIEKMESRTEAIGPMLDVLGRFAQFVTARADADECEVVRTWLESYLAEVRRKNV
jgi:transposase